MKKIVFILLPFISIFSQAQITFQKTFGGTNVDQGNSVLETMDGGFIVAGYTNSFGAGGNDVYLVKTSSDGTLQWAKTFGGTGDDYGNSIQQTNDGGFVIAGTTTSFGGEDVYLVKTASDGTLQWSKTIGGPSGGGAGYSIQLTNDGGFIITGKTGMGAGYSDVYLIKTDSVGILEWTKTFGGTNGESGTSVQQTNDGGFILTGFTTSFGAGQADVYLVKTFSDGSLQWAKTFGGTNGDWGNCVQQTNDGGFIVAGLTWSFITGSQWSDDVYLIKTNSTGTLLWTKTYGGSGRDEGNSIQKTTDGGFIIAGFSTSFGPGSADGYLLKIDSAGNPQWSKTFDGASLDIGYSVQQCKDEGYIITGGPQSILDDIFLIKTDSNGNSGLMYCHQQSPTSLVGSGGTSGSGGFEGTGGVESNAGTLTGSGGIETSLCTKDGVNENSRTNIISISPNPFSTEATIKIKDSGSGIKDLKLQMYNVFGQEVQPIVIRNSDSFVIRRGNLPSGIYFYKVSADGKILGTGKAVVE